MCFVSVLASLLLRCAKYKHIYLHYEYVGEMEIWVLVYIKLLVSLQNYFILSLSKLGELPRRYITDSCCKQYV